MRGQAIREVARRLRSDIYKSSIEEAVSLYRETNDDEGFLVGLYSSPPRKPVVRFVRFKPQEMDEIIRWATEYL